ncbi:hypothetical protein EJB05_00711, partial [Eragrostis curvula]
DELISYLFMYKEIKETRMSFLGDRRQKMVFSCFITIVDVFLEHAQMMA